MQRNSSFFWASDSLRETSSYDDDDEGGTMGLSMEDDHDDDDDNNEYFAPIHSETQPMLPPQPPPPTSYGSQQQQPSPHAVPRRIVVGSKAAGASPPPQQQQPYGGTAARGAAAGLHIPMSPQVGTRKTMQQTVLRFQVVIWHVGNVDVCQGTVTMRFRITLFWNDASRSGSDSRKGGPAPSPAGAATQTTTTTHATPADDPTADAGWIMHGRQRACRHALHSESSTILETIPVPPVSILNAVTFDVLGDPEVTMLDPITRLFRWSCMYNATLFQGDHMRVDAFPHDAHHLKLKLGVLAHRGRGSTWDRMVYAFGLATADDSQGSTKIPHGLVVDHVTIPDFSYDARHLDFQFVPLLFGQQARDSYLQITLPVYRLSGLYDRTIMPILALLNFVAITCLPRNFASATASTETMLSIAFVQVAIRLTIDSHLPSVGYEIKMQTVMNQCFWCICALVIESNVVFFLVTKRGWKIYHTDRMDLVTAIVGVAYTAYILALYYDKHWKGAEAMAKK